MAAEVCLGLRPGYVKLRKSGKLQSPLLADWPLPARAPAITSAPSRRDRRTDQAKVKARRTATGSPSSE